VQFIQKNTTIPVLGHADGVCHLYIDKEADLELALKITNDAKTQYPAVCNAIETILVHSAIAEKFLLQLDRLFSQRVTLKVCDRVKEILKTCELVTDWHTEWLDDILSVKIVDSLTEAIEHINLYGSSHSDGIVTENEHTKKQFLALVDSANVMVNCSTRFSDGFRYGFGAEIGVSTNKIHARGPVGLEGLMIYKYQLVGKGQIVADYCGKQAKTFKHLKL
jgi:glutamate-5-semialdehyde dehydrogenase